MLQSISNSVSAGHIQNNNIQKNKPVQKAVSEESKINASERSETSSAERSEKTNKVTGNKIDTFA